MTNAGIEFEMALETERLAERLLSAAKHRVEILRTPEFAEDSAPQARGMIENMAKAIAELNRWPC